MARYEKQGADASSYGFKLALKHLRTSTEKVGVAGTGLQARKITRARLQAKVRSLEKLYSPNSPMTVRENGDGTYTILDGNHRYMAMDYLIRRQEEHGVKCIYTWDTLIPCLVYVKDIPIGLAMNYCSVVNDLQLCASGGNALDTLRFVHNMIDQLGDGYSPRVSTHAFVSSPLLCFCIAFVLCVQYCSVAFVLCRGSDRTAASIQESMTSFFTSQDTAMPAKWTTSNYVPNVIKFLKYLGTDGLQEAERLQDLDVKAIYAAVRELCPDLVCSTAALFSLPNFEKHRSVKNTDLCFSQICVFAKA